MNNIDLSKLYNKTRDSVLGFLGFLEVTKCTVSKKLSRKNKLSKKELSDKATEGLVITTHLIRLALIASAYITQIGKEKDFEVFSKSVDEHFDLMAKKDHIILDSMEGKNGKGKK